MELFYFIGAAALAGGLIYAVTMYRSRNKANDALTEAKTRQLYDKN